MPSFFEFFAGGGMARAGLQHGWRCLFANDFDLKKSATYRTNWGDGEMVHGDVRRLTTTDLPDTTPDLVWASFPCQDLSLAGGGAGLKGDRSGTFWPFWRLMEGLAEAGKAPRIIALENVIGTLTSHQGRDFQAIMDAFAALGYQAGALVMDAERFVPQSRPRLFFVGVQADQDVQGLASKDPHPVWHPDALLRAHAALSEQAKEYWRWWSLPLPPARTLSLADILEDAPVGVDWHNSNETDRLLAMMAPLHMAKVRKAMKAGGRHVGGVYRRTRKCPDGFSVQRAEVRFDGLSGCLRTPAGGSSRQVLLVIEGKKVRSRLISARETARLMGLPDSYELPDRYNEAYHLTGDGVVVPVVQFLSTHLLLPLIGASTEKMAA